MHWVYQLSTHTALSVTPYSLWTRKCGHLFTGTKECWRMAYPIMKLFDLTSKILISKSESDSETHSHSVLRQSSNCPPLSQRNGVFHRKVMNKKQSILFIIATHKLNKNSSWWRKTYICCNRIIVNFNHKTLEASKEIQHNTASLIYNLMIEMETYFTVVMNSLKQTMHLILGFTSVPFLKILFDYIPRKSVINNIFRRKEREVTK